jgi:hypothetical protein
MVSPGVVELRQINILQFTLSRMRASVSPCNFHFNNTFSGRFSPHQGECSFTTPHFGAFLDSHLHNAFLWCNFLANAGLAPLGCRNWIWRWPILTRRSSKTV